MLPLVAARRCAYVAMHMRGDAQTMTQHTDYGGDVPGTVAAELGADDRITLVGPTIASGYLADPGRTASAFDLGPVRRFHTDDIGRLYADGTLHVLGRIDGVGNVIVFGARDYAMRIWLDPARVASRNLTAGEVMLAMRAANLQVAAGSINQAPAVSPGGFTLSVQTLGRLSTPEEFGAIVLRADHENRKLMHGGRL